MLVGNLTGRKHDLAIGAVDQVAVVINIDELIIGADLLELSVGRQQRTMLPQPDVLDRRVVAPQIGGGELFIGRKVFALDFIQTIGAPRALYVAFDKHTLRYGLVGRHAKTLHKGRIEIQPCQMDQDQPSHANEKVLKPRSIDLEERKPGSNQSQ